MLVSANKVYLASPNSEMRNRSKQALIGLDIRSKFTNLIGGGQPSRPIYPDRSVVLFSRKSFPCFFFAKENTSLSVPLVWRISDHNNLLQIPSLPVMKDTLLLWHRIHTSRCQVHGSKFLTNLNLLDAWLYRGMHEMCLCRSLGVSFVGGFGRYFHLSPNPWTRRR